MAQKVLIVPLLEDGTLIYPPTITPAVIDPKTGMTLDKMLERGITPDMKGFVSVFPQFFTDEEKWQARNNINAMPADTPIPSQVTEEVVSSWGFTKNTGDYSKPVSGIPVSDLSLEVRELLRKANTALQSESDPTVPSWAKQPTKPTYTAQEVGAYSKPSTGIPSTDLSSAVQTSLGKADTALQSETDPTVPSWAKQSSKPSYSASEVGAVPTTRTVNGKALSSDISLDASDVGALPSSTPIPVVPTNVSAFQNDAGYLTSHQDISGKEDKTNKVTSLSSSSTDTQYPSAKCVYDMVGNIETLLASI